jgi:NADH:ubiquinone oxidoreductase subunit E
MENIIGQYKGNKSEVIQALQDTQKAYGYISKEHLQWISKELGTPYSYTYALATFYKSFSLQERGKYVIKICDGTACHLQLSEDIIAELTSYLQVGIGETSPDKLFTLEQVNCLGACAMAPVISINEKLYGKLTRKKVREIIDDLRKSPPVSAHENVSTVISGSFEKVKQVVDKLGKALDRVREGK